MVIGWKPENTIPKEKGLVPCNTYVDPLIRGIFYELTPPPDTNEDEKIHPDETLDGTIGLIPP